MIQQSTRGFLILTWQSTPLTYFFLAETSRGGLSYRPSMTSYAMRIASIRWTSVIASGRVQSRELASVPPKVGKFIDRSKKEEQKKNLLIKAGLPFVFFSVLASWVVSSAIGGKLKERELSRGLESKSIRQAKLEEEHEEMIERLNKIVETDFDNTKRIKRPHEILEERRKERKSRNRWYRRLYRAVIGDSQATK